MRLEQITAWSPIAAIRLGKTEEDPRKPRAPRDQRGLSEGDVEAVDPMARRPDDRTPSGDHTVDIRV